MGTRSATGRITAAMLGDIANLLDASETGTPTASLGDSLPLSYTTGTQGSQMDRVWSDKGRAITSGASEDIDLFDFGSIDVGAGAGLDALGQSLALAEIVAITIQNLSTSSGTLIVGAKGDSTEWESLWGDGSTVILPPGAFNLAAMTADPAWTVADATNHILKFAASGGNLVYDIHIFGRSA